jgi:CRISPR-associated protein Cas1
MARYKAGTSVNSRIIDLGTEPIEIRSQLDCLIVRDLRIPYTEIACLIFNARTKLSSSVVSLLAQNGGVSLFLDNRFMPAALALSFEGHSRQAERMAVQVAATQAVKDGLWSQVVRAKIRAQSSALDGNPTLDGLVLKILPGDASNIEAQAARIYWPKMMGEGFHRDRELADENTALNYGYAVLRAVTARALCAQGLHPSLGIHHSNKRNAFALADDMMEPYRPIVDRACRSIRKLEKDDKRKILEVLAEVPAEKSATSLWQCFLGKEKELWFR